MADDYADLYDTSAWYRMPRECHESDADHYVPYDQVRFYTDDSHNLNIN
ncbi:MAG: hypothetical protein O2780_10795 [Proteobacteria bacterium]|nr:hypothetical protein [Pseudomonadota bacterium]